MNFLNEELLLKADDIYEDFNVDNFEISVNIGSRFQCPTCKGESINRNGKTKLNRQRYLCKDCGKSFSETTGSPLSYSKKSIDKWLNYISCMKKRLSLRESAKVLKINLVTSFHWRHKILSVIGTKIIDKKLCNTIEVHELKIKENFKGNRKREPRMYKQCNTEEVYETTSNLVEMAYGNYQSLYEKNYRRVVSILSCKDSQENTYFKAVVIGGVTRQILDKVLAPVIKNGKVLGTSSNINYVNFAKSNKLKLSMMGSRIHVIDGINIRRAQDQSRVFKKFLKAFRGVASKYMSYYVNWFKVWIENNENTSLALMRNFITGKRQLRTYEFERVNFDGTLCD